MISDRLQRLRKELQREHLAAYIFLSSDPHDSEYVAAHWQGRQWLTGFTGSAGVAVVTQTAAALWTDSRYFIAAEQQLQGTEFQLMRDGLDGTPTIADWLGTELAETREKDVAIDGNIASYEYIKQLKADLTQHGGLTLRTNFDPFDRIWTDRPPLPTAHVGIHNEKYAGEPATEKIQRTRQALRQQHADGTLVTTLDDIAWLLNLRGDDIMCNPVFISYLLLTTRSVTLFINPQKLSAEVKIYLNHIGVDVKDYDKVNRALKTYPDYSILIDPATTNYTLTTAIACKHIIYSPSPIPALKAVKNATEIDGFHHAMIRDGVAMVRFLHWLETTLGKEEISELTVDEQLTARRAEQDLYKGLSFPTIAAYEEHGAIVHYEATEQTNSILQPRGFLLLDSGAQYLDSTTDITRTIALGPLTDQQRQVYTLVLKGHIQLAQAIFPAGTTGTQLDSLARQPLWHHGMNFLHGTGHGVGAFLNVHEGPQAIRMQWQPTPLTPGMTVTNEPGIYLEGRFGVRIENLMLVKKQMETEHGQFFAFETLTLCPIDTTPICGNMLSIEEINWLNAYHERVFSALAPYLPDADKAWLQTKTKAIALNT